MHIHSLYYVFIGSQNPLCEPNYYDQDVSLDMYAPRAVYVKD